MTDALPIAGWYPDPELPGQDRWWDGASWGPQRRPTAASVPAGAGPLSPAAGPTPPDYAPVAIQRNTLAIVGFVLSMSGVVLPFVLNSLAGGIVSAVALRRSRQLLGGGIVSTGRGLSIAGILIGFIWGGLCLLFVAVIVAFSLWAIGTAQNFQYPDSPVA